jgi:hypothetical protein
MKYRFSITERLRHFLYCLLRAVVIWWKAEMLDYPYWRVIYKDGKKTRLLYWREANGLKKVFNGRSWIDYKGIIKK